MWRAPLGEERKRSRGKWGNKRNGGIGWIEGVLEIAEVEDGGSGYSSKLCLRLANNFFIRSIDGMTI